MDDGEIEPGLDAVVEEDGVEDFARGRVEPERNVGDAEDGQDAGHSLLDQPDAFDVSMAEVVNSGSPVARVKVSASKIKVFGAETVFAGDDVVDRAGDFEFALARFWPCPLRRW